MSEFPYTEPISEYIQGYQIGFEDGKADGERELAEWFAECEKVSEPIKEYTINRWLEDFAKWQKEQKK